MTKARLDGTKALFFLTAKRLEAAETALGAVLGRLSALDAEIAELVIDFARSGDEGSLAAVELTRGMTALRIEEKRRSRGWLEVECDRLRAVTARLLRQKIMLEQQLAGAEREQRFKQNRS